MRYQKVLVLAPHTDDAELGAGGSIARMLEENADVFVAVFSSADASVPVGQPSDTLRRECESALSILGVPEANIRISRYEVRHLSEHRQEILEDMVAMGKSIRPDLVLLPSTNDVHQDHQVVSAEGLRAFKMTSVLGYELPWNHVTFTAQAFVALEPRHVSRKWEALRVYTSQIELGRQYFREEFIRSLAHVRGTQVGRALAEAFEVMRVHL